MNKSLDLVFDGSFIHNTMTIGIGGLTVNSHDIADECIVSKAFKIPEKAARDNAFQKYGSLVAEMLAAKIVLDNTQANSRIRLYGDCSTVIDTINGFKSLNKIKELKPVVTSLKSSINRHKLVKAFLIVSRDADSLNPAAKGIVHNASALASQGLKIERTVGYEGSFSHRTILFNGLAQADYQNLRSEGKLPKPDHLTAERIDLYLNGRRRDRYHRHAQMG